MAKIMKMSDRIKLKIGEIEVVIAPLSFSRKQDFASCTKIVGGKEEYDLGKAQYLYMKYSIKDIKGLENYDGSKYELQFSDESKSELTDECVDELMNIEIKQTLMNAMWQLLNGIQELKDPMTGEKLEGVNLEVMSQGK
jgi:hypothetical protein